MNLDPLVIKYKPISLNIDFSLTSHINYIKFRQKGLSKIYFISNNFNIEKMIQYKAIGFMDQIFLNNNEISIENIETIASVCLLLSLEFKSIPDSFLLCCIAIPFITFVLLNTFLLCLRLLL